MFPPPPPERTLSSGRPGCAWGCFRRTGRPGPASNYDWYPARTSNAGCAWHSSWRLLTGLSSPPGYPVSSPGYPGTGTAAVRNAAASAPGSATAQISVRHPSTSPELPLARSARWTTPVCAQLRCGGRYRSI
eukprot:817193-Prorocentrum_minimum.AAC.1